MEYRYGSHTIYKIEYHFVWVTKYRYQMLTGDLGLRLRDMVRQSCEAFEIKILSGVVSKDPVHTLVSALPNMVPSEIMRRVITLPQSGRLDGCEQPQGLPMLRFGGLLKVSG